MKKRIKNIGKQLILKNILIEQMENMIENKEFINIEGVILLNKGNLNYVK